MSHDQAVRSGGGAVEWPTIALVGGIYAAFFALTWFWRDIPLWLWLPLAAWTSAWWGSVQHEILHGHPTRSRALNTLLATPPLWLWLPFECYRSSHLTHHNDERLTDPLDDPESRYVTPEQWQALGPIGRRLVAWQGTLLGRLVIGPIWATAIFWKDEVRRLLLDTPGARRIWGWHLVWVALLLGWVSGICGLPFWQYLLGFAYGGTSLALIRSFCEHRAKDNVEERTAIVENAPVFGLLFLNNNLHVVHHRWPAAPWYRLPALYRANRAALIAANGGLVYQGYGDIARRYLFRPHDLPVHPNGRVPHRAMSSASRLATNSSSEACTPPSSGGAT